MSNMVTSLLSEEKITTTHTRAKELRRSAERMITFAKRGDLHARRQVLRFVADKQVVSKLFDELGPRYKSRSGGYTRIVKLGPRRGDGTFMSIIELVDRPGAARGVRRGRVPLHAVSADDPRRGGHEPSILVVPLLRAAQAAVHALDVQTRPRIAASTRAPCGRARRDRCGRGGQSREPVGRRDCSPSTWSRWTAAPC